MKECSEMSALFYFLFIFINRGENMTVFYVLLAIIFVLVFILGCLVCFVSGYTFAQHEMSKKEYRPPPEPTQEEIRKSEQKQREYENFMKYDGSPQG